jgi:hypothetical protein
MMGKQQLRRPDRVEAEGQTICLASHLAAKNEGLRRAARELSLETAALRQQLNGMKRAAGVRVNDHDGT